MSYLRSIFSALTSPFRRSRIHGEMDEELGSHIQHRADDLERSGLPRREAERRARIEFGGMERYREECHEATGGSGLEKFAQDLRFAARMLRKSPGFSAVALVTLALGIGANAVVFSILSAFVLRPLDVPQADRLVMLERGADHFPSESYADYVDVRDRARAFDGLIAYEIAPAGLNSTGTPARIWLYEASGNYFDVLGIQPYLGRFFHAGDEHGPNSAPYIVLSYGYWQSHFQGDRSVVGRVVQLNKYSYTILGVAPSGFRGTERFFAPDLWVPKVNVQQIEGINSLGFRGQRSMWLVGRLRAGVSVAQANADLSSVASVMTRLYPKDDDGISFALARPGLLGDMLGRPIRAFVTGLMLLSSLILLAACANLGSLFASRAADRAREIALRLALGSSRARIVRQMVMEALLVALAGGILGVAGSVPLLHALSAWQPIPEFPVNVPVDPDVRTYLLALGLALVSGLLFGLVPLRQILRANPSQHIRAGSTGVAQGRWFSLRDVLVAGQIAVCAVLVTSSLVALRGMMRSLHSDFGFIPEHALQVSTDLGMGGYTPDQAPAMQRRMLDAVARVPGVKAVGYADRIPLNIGWSDSTVFRDSTSDYRLSNAVADAVTYDVSPGYFDAAATPLLRGRTFTWDDGKQAPRVAVVNQEFARMLFGSESQAVGNHFKLWGGERVEVVGVVADGRYRTLSEDTPPAMFLSILQSPSTGTTLVVRTEGDASEIGPVLQQTLRALNTGLPFTVNPWIKELDTALFPARAASMALGVLGGLGGLLVATGIFGMAAYSVSKRLREFGIRIALGAGRGQVLGAALGRAFRLLAIGSVAGLLLGLAATKVLAFIVYQASPRDPLVLAGAVGFMVLLGLVATWVPAQRALGADPLVLLREE
jgi:predicted permease